MSKLDRLIDQWISDGHFASREEAADEIARMVAEQLARNAERERLRGRILNGYRAVASGGIFRSNGDFEQDRKRYLARKAKGK